MNKCNERSTGFKVRGWISSPAFAGEDIKEVFVDVSLLTQGDSILNFSYPICEEDFPSFSLGLVLRQSKSGLIGKEAKNLYDIRFREPIISRVSARSPPNTAPVVSDGGSVEPGNRRRARGGPRGSRSVSVADSDAQEPLGLEGAGEREGRGERRRVLDRPSRTVHPRRPQPGKTPLPPTDRNSPKFTQGGRAVEGEVALCLRYRLRLPRR
ncbi:PREDICTED: uncharacterized protein LOC103589276 [Galeopterus variegatus]|uniref:Uncharacterized protein LOC103589276 n=1 Tax=Galeopterus variegatus TaxID=482537 RepID=A0ABM0QM45_GALVR|nr:PREDICTED: uncharacterized protein LOC103589276 [Galeopterus variegatus]